jgi:hypothetical protein
MTKKTNGWSLFLGEDENDRSLPFLFPSNLGPRFSTSHPSEISHVLGADVSWPDFKQCRFYCELPSPTWTNGKSAGQKLEQCTVLLTERLIFNSRKTK